MPYEMKPNTGSLFKNDKKTEDTHANARGSALIDGVEYWIDAWTNEGSKGKYQSLKFKRKDAPRAPLPEAATRSPRSFDDMPDDCPF